MSVAAANIDRAVELLLGGGVVAFPTDTVYGVGALPSQAAAVERIYKLKGRPRTRGLIVHLHHRDGMETYASEVPDYVVKLADAFWPGPLTIVLRRKASVPEVVTGGRDTVGLRIPNHPMALRLLEQLSTQRGTPAGIAAPSANRFGEPNATTAQEVVARLGTPGSGPNAPDLILDGGACPGKVPSTILDCAGDWPRLLRRGSTSVEAIEETIGRFVKM